DDRLEAFYDNPNAFRDYFLDIGRMVLAAEGRKANDSHADCYQYFCVPEYGTANGRLHFHAVHFMRTLPTGSGIILTLSVSRLLNLLLRLVAFLLFLNPQCLASISRWITASSSWKRFCLFVCRALSSIMVICMLTAIRLLLTFVMSLYL